MAGDVIGAETLLFGCYTFEGVALSKCLLAPWPGGEAGPANDSLLLALAQTERRAADVLSLRCGQAVERIRRLIRLLVQDRDGIEHTSPVCRVVLPGLKDMADITALTVETVSRSISNLRRAGILEPQGLRRGRPPAQLCMAGNASQD